jgi:hypothetical protein
MTGVREGSTMSLFAQSLRLRDSAENFHASTVHVVTRSNPDCGTQDFKTLMAFKYRRILCAHFGNKKYNIQTASPFIQARECSLILWVQNQWDGV